MPQVTFIDAQGQYRTIEGSVGDSLLQIALAADLPGVVGECGGMCTCATCHVYVDPSWVDRLPPIDDYEDEMLDGTLCERLPTSRLCCQIELREDLSGLTVTTPERQT